jgi:hypothetical protein
VIALQAREQEEEVKAAFSFPSSVLAFGKQDASQLDKLEDDLGHLQGFAI